MEKASFKLVFVIVLLFSTTCKSLSYFFLSKFTSDFVLYLIFKDHSLERSWLYCVHKHQNYLIIDKSTHI